MYASFVNCIQFIVTIIYAESNLKSHAMYFRYYMYQIQGIVTIVTQQISYEHSQTSNVTCPTKHEGWTIELPKDHNSKETIEELLLREIKKNVKKGSDIKWWRFIIFVLVSEAFFYYFFFILQLRLWNFNLNSWT